MLAFRFEKGPLLIMRLLRTSNFILYCQNDFFQLKNVSLC